MTRFLQFCQIGTIMVSKTALSDSSNIRNMAGIIYHDKYKQLVQVDNRSKMAVEKYEQTNIPATILGATASRWKYMPSFKTAHDENSSSAY